MSRVVPAGDVEVLLVRHGRTAVNAQGRLSGRHDPDLDDVGRAQAASIGAEVAELAARRAAAGAGGDVAVVSSPLGRCMQTAAAILDALGERRAGSPGGGVHATGVEVEPRMIEMDYGEWDGRPIAEVPASAWVRWRTEEDFCPPGGETLAQVTARVSVALTERAASTDASTLVVVSHVSPIKAGVLWALGARESATWRMRLDNASITRISATRVEDRDGATAVRPTLHSFNETAHLRRVGPRGPDGTA